MEKQRREEQIEEAEELTSLDRSEAKSSHVRIALQRPLDTAFLNFAQHANNLSTSSAAFTLQLL